jgi:hypothetical protein
MDGRRISALLGLLLAGGVLTGCTGAATNSSTAGGSGSGRAAELPAAAGGPAKADSNPAPKEQPVNQPGVDRKLIRTATLEMASPDVIKVANGARDVAVGLGGFAGQEDVRNDAATITLQVPSNQFDEALRRLSDLVTPENLRSRATTAEDVTEQLVDLDSRIATQRTSVARVRALMDKAQTVNEVVQIEGEVTRREADLESLEKRREALSGQVALSKITVKVGKSGEAPPPPARDDSGILGGLAGGWHAFLTAGGVVLRVIAAMLPFLVVFGVPGWFALRWWLRRRRPAAVPAVDAST